MKKCIDKTELWPVYMLSDPGYSIEPTFEVPDELAARANAAYKEMFAVSKLLQEICGGTDE